MIRLERDRMQNAINRAKVIRPKVRMIGERTYAVTGSTGSNYTVRFAVVNGMKLAECNCRAGSEGQVCFHVAAAAGANIIIQGMRKLEAAKPQATRLPEGVLVKTSFAECRIDGIAI